MKNILAVTALSVASLSATSLQAETPSYSYLEAAYFDAGEIDGFSFDGSYAFNENVFVFAGVAKADADIGGEDVDMDSSAIGIGYSSALSEKTSWYTSIAYLRADAVIDFGYGSFSVDDNGFGLDVGVRSFFSEQVELGISAAYVDIFNETDIDINGYVQFHITENLGITLDVSSSDGYDYGIGVRLNF